MKRKHAAVVSTVLVVTVAVALVVSGLRKQREKKWSLAFGDYLADRMAEIGGSRPTLDPARFTFRVVSSSRRCGGLVVIFADKTKNPPDAIVAAYLPADGRIKNAISAAGSDGKMRILDESISVDCFGPEALVPLVLPMELHKYLSSHGMVLEGRATKE